MEAEQKPKKWSLRPRVRTKLYNKTIKELFWERKLSIKTTQPIWYKLPLAYCHISKRFYHPKSLILIYLN